MSTKNPNLYVIAGPNGAGKTTFAREFLPHYVDCLEFVNADLIAYGISPLAPERASVRAGKIMLEQIRILAKRRCDFGFETTLAGKIHVRFFRELKSTGYHIHLFFLWLSSIDLAFDRIAKRVAMGGHNVPMATVRRRYEKGMVNLSNLYLPLFDSWTIFDNSTETPLLIARCESGKQQVVNHDLFEKIRADGSLLWEKLKNQRISN